MGKKTTAWLIAAGALVLIGCALFVGAMWMQNWDFTKLSTSKFETNTYKVGEEFTDISINTDTADIQFLPSEDGRCTVVCKEEANAKHAVRVGKDTLMIQLQNNKAWYEYIGIHFGSPKITIYLPQGQYGNIVIKESTGDVEIPKDFSFASIDISLSTGDVHNYASTSENMKIQTSTGNICLEDVTADMIAVSVSTGNTRLSNVRCRNLTSTGNTGDLSLQNVIATGDFSIERSTGDVIFDRCDAAQIVAETDTGSVTGSLLSDKVFLAQSSTGSIHVPKTTTGGRCEITTSTGVICITVDKN